VKGRDKTTLNRELVLVAALKLIDRDGVAGLSLRDLANELGVFPTAIYWYVPNRNELIAGSVSLALGKVSTGLTKGTWQERIRLLLRRFRAAMRRHPNLAPVIGGQLISNSPLDLPMLDHIVAALEDAGFESQALVDAFNVVVAAMCGFPTLELAMPPREDADAWTHAHRERVRQIPLSDCPALTRHIERLQNRAFILRWSGGVKKPMSTSFEAWLDVVIGGLELQAARLHAQASF